MAKGPQSNITTRIAPNVSNVFNKAFGYVPKDIRTPGAVKALERMATKNLDLGRTRSN